MTRVTSTVLVILVLLNGTVTVMSGSGLSEDLGVSLAPGVDDTLDSLLENLKDGFSAEAGLGDTLFSLFAAALDGMQLVVQGAYSAPTMMINLGFPAWIVFPFFAPMYIVGFLELVYAASGRNLV